MSGFPSWSPAKPSLRSILLCRPLLRWRLNLRPDCGEASKTNRETHVWAKRIASRRVFGSGDGVKGEKPQLPQGGGGRHRVKSSSRRTTVGT